MDGSVIVRTDSGRIRGYRQDGAVAFRGIPYANPPVGPNRFLPPQPIQPWDDVLDASKFGPVAPQPPSVTPPYPPEQSEAGCLTLNIWTPNTDDKKRPVLFWIHGGAMTGGSAANTGVSGRKLAAHGDVVVVSINYRLGLLGFLYLPPTTANVGLLDQIEALKWVNRNIRRFGGDPTNVTLFGQSAGGISITALMTMPRAKGLFRRGIVQSAVCYPYAHKATSGELLSKRVFSVLGIQYGDLETMRTIPFEKLVEAYQRARLGHFDTVVTPPFPDGEIVPVHPLEAVRKGAASDIEFMAGANENEATLWSPMNPVIDKMDDKALHNGVRYVLSDVAPDERMLDTVLGTYMNDTAGDSIAGRRRAYEDVGSDFLFRVPVLRYLDAQCQHQPKVYSYMFAWKTPELGGVLGATHTLEIPFVFGTLGDKPAGIYPAKTSETDKISVDMMDAWIGFARLGDPNHNGIPTWPVYNAETRPTMVFDKETRAETNSFAKRNAVWKGII